MEYNNIIDGNINRLGRLVQNAIDAGWQPMGGVVVHPRTEWDELHYIQTMVKGRIVEVLSWPVDMTD